jgi:RsiW-degrading membrane proteinase PrsW (M82 family)
VQAPSGNGLQQVSDLSPDLIPQEKEMNINTPLRRAFYNSALHQTSGKIVLATILGGLFLFAFPTFVRYYTVQPLQFLAALPLGFLIYLPTILVLRFLDRREREPALLFWGCVFALILFFCPVSSRTTYFLADALQINARFVVGPVEELMKVAPLLLLVIFARPAVNGVRDGFIYAALGGLGFAILETAASFALTDFPEKGWSVFWQDIFGRMTFLGTDIHIVWSALVGAAIGYGVISNHRWLKYLVPIGVYLFVAAVHDLNDLLLHAILPTFGIEFFILGLVAPLSGLSLEQLAPLLESNLAFLYVTLIFGATFNLVVGNIIILPILFWILWRSGDDERRVAREQLKGEPETVITPTEYSGVEAELRFHLRTVPGYPKKIAKAILQLQNELAFRKEYLLAHDGDPNIDPPAQMIREEIARLRDRS